MDKLLNYFGSSNLTSSQFSIWMSQKLNPDAPLNNMTLSFFIQGELKPEAFCDAFHALVSRSDALRIIIEEQDGIPLQLVREKVPFNIEFIDLSDDPDSVNTIHSRLKKRAILPFDLKECLFDSALIKLKDDEFIWYLNQHHLISDAWSCVVLYRRMAEFYQLALMNCLDDAPELPLYSDFLAYEREFLESESCSSALAFWQGKTGEPMAAFEFYGHTPAAHSTRTKRVYCDIGQARSEKLRKLARSEGFRSFSLDLSLFYIFSSLLFAYLYRISGRTSITIGAPAHNRPTATFKDTIGLFIELFPLGVNITQGETFRSLIKSVIPETHDFLKHALPGASSAISGKTYSVILNYINVSFPNFCGLPMRSAWIYPEHGVMGHALGLTIHDFDASGSFHLLFNFSADFFDHEFREKAVGHFMRLVDALLEDPDQRIDDIALLSPAEHKALVSSYNETHTSLPEDITVVDQIREQAAKTPDAIAIRDDGQNMTYRELDQTTDWIAHSLQNRGIGGEMIVGVFMERSMELIVALISIIKAGAAFVPIDSSFPQKRISYLLEDCGAPIVLTQKSLVNRLLLAKVEIIPIESLSNQATGGVPPHLGSTADSRSLAYVIYTSGSTGQPKGVMIEHGSLFNYLYWARQKYMHDGPHDFPLFSSVAADLTITSIFLPLISGSKVVIYRESKDGVDLSILKVFKDDEVDIIKLTPSHLALLEGDNVPANRLKKLIVGGEDFKSSLARRITSFFSGNIEIYNEYGPTEATVGCMIYLFDPDHYSNASVAIGEPIDNLRIYLLNAAMNPVPIGVRGEIYIAGSGLARGYLNQEELTADKFVDNPFQPGERMYRSGDVGSWRSEGVMEFLGRKDGQVKVRGFRIELGEIEAALLEFSGIRESCTLVAHYLKHIEQDSAIAELNNDIDEVWVNKILQEAECEPDEKIYSNIDRRIAAYYVGAQEYTSEELRSFLSSSLPSYMIPSYFIKMESFPLNTTGKVDRSALPLPDMSHNQTAGEYVAPRNAVEKLLVETWAKVLGVARVGIHDNFFDLGGDSILNIQIVSRAAKAGLEFTPGLLFKYQTVAELAANIDAKRMMVAEQGPINGRVPLTPIQHWFFKLDLPDPQIWNMVLKLDVAGEVTPKILEKAFQFVLLYHDSLRLSFMQKTSGWEQTIREDENTFGLVNYNLSDLPVSEQVLSIDHYMKQAQSSLDLQNGPLVRALYFDRGLEDNLLGIVIHHLAMDVVSWYIFMEDLEAVFRQIDAGDSPFLPRKTTSFKQWAEKLNQFANAQDCESALAYWLNQSGRPVKPLPRDFNLPGNGLETSSQSIVVTLDHQATHDLIYKVTQSSQIKVDELLLAAIVQTLCSWSGSPELRLDKEGHGREDVFEGVALYRTLGWFTSLYPLHLAIPDGQEVEQIISTVKDQMRALPYRGLGYGLLRYLNSDSSIRDTLKQQVPDAEVLFNYLGTLHQMTGQSELFQLNGPLQLVRDPSGKRPYLLDVSALVIDDQLKVQWTFSAERHRRETIDLISGKFIESLRMLIAHCLKPPIKKPGISDILLTDPDAEKIRRMNNVEDAYSLSPLQSGMLFHTLDEPGSGVYIEQYSCTLTGNLQKNFFQQAWQTVVQLHPVLRTAFFWKDLDKPLQVVHRMVKLQWETEDLEKLSEDDLNEWLENCLRDDRIKGFELDKAPLMRFRLFRLRRHTYKMVWSFHHILCDGWSTPIIIRQVLQHYHSLCKGETPEKITYRPYRDFITWLQKQDLQSAERYWRDKLRGVTTPTPLTVRQFQTDRKGYDQKELTLSSQMTADLKAAARKKRLTLNTLIQGAWAILLHRYSGEEDIVFGSTVSGRPPFFEGVEQMIGLFINTIPVRATIKQDVPLSSWLAQLMLSQAEAREYEFTPLVKVQEWSELPPGVPLFDTIVVFENYPSDDSAERLNPELQISDVQFREQSNYPLALLVLPGNSLRLIAVYDRSLFPEGSISRVLNHLSTLLHSFSVQPDQLIKDLSILSKFEQRQLSEWKETNTIAPAPQPVLRFFENQAQQDPNRDAVVCGAQCLTYGEINRRANRLAHYLQGMGAEQGSFLGIYMDRSIEMITAIMAILKSGAAYVPLDPTYPAERLSYMITDTGIQAVLSLSTLEHNIPDTVAKVISIDDEGLEISQFSDTNLPESSLPDDLAYIIYTSGSTGTPKGVMINHGNLTHATEARIHYYENHFERFLLLSSISFDSSVAGIFGTLCRGGCLYIPDEEHYRDVSYIAGLIADKRITHILCIPALYQQMLQFHQPDLGSLKTVIVAGEPCMHEMVNEHLAHLPETRLYNEYGPTEATVWSTAFDCHQNFSSASVPIGRPIENTQIYVLDKDLRQVPPGISGELYLGGSGISPGYLSQPEMTAEHFIANPFASEKEGKLYKTGDIVRFLDDGNLEFLERNDEQIKLLGYRIEPGEVEAALLAHSNVRQAVVIPAGVPGYVTQQTGIYESQDAETIAEYLSILGPDKAEQILAAVEMQVTDKPAADKISEEVHADSASFPSADPRGSSSWTQKHTDFEIGLRINNKDFIKPPRLNQREWLVRQTINEFEADLEHLDDVAKHFVAGRTTDLTDFDISQSKLEDDRIMEDWQIPVMKAMARNACEAGGDLLEIGFGRGISSGFIQDLGVQSHTIVESNKAIINEFFEPWKQNYSGRNILMIEGRWQDVLDKLATYDAVFFHAFPLNEVEFTEYILNSITFAEHFFPVAARLLKTGGIFTYLSTEIDSLSRRHQRALFQYFSSITLEVQKLSVPDDTIDTWWADSMVIVKAVK